MTVVHLRAQPVPLVFLPTALVQGGRGTGRRCRGEHSLLTTWILRALKNEGHLPTGDAESTGLIWVHFIPKAPFSETTSYTKCRQHQLVPWEVIHIPWEVRTIHR